MAGRELGLAEPSPASAGNKLSPRSASLWPLFFGQLRIKLVPPTSLMLHVPDIGFEGCLPLQDVSQGAGLAEAGTSACL